MCGIVGYVDSKDASTIVLNGLKKLEYRGNDSAGIVSVNGDLDIRRAKGKLINLDTESFPFPGLGITLPHCYGRGTQIEGN